MGSYVVALAGNRTMLVDEQDLDVALAHRWRVKPNGYAVRTIRRHGRDCEESFHRRIMQAPAGQQVDHINHCTLDNRRENLRLLTNAQNGQNRSGATSRSKTGVRGVSWNVREQRYYVRVKVNGHQFHGGVFTNIHEAERRAVELRKQLMTHSTN
jgi:hypothetical protein